MERGERVGDTGDGSERIYPILFFILVGSTGMTAGFSVMHQGRGNY